MYRPGLVDPHTLGPTGAAGGRTLDHTVTMAPTRPPSAPPGGSAAFDAMSDAVLAVAGERQLEPVLVRLVHAARGLVGARFAALGVPDEDGVSFARFIHAGMSDALVDEIGPLPRTHGLLGAQLTDAAPHRSDDIRTDPRFSWWPAAHPRMRSFLSVPIVFRGDVIGAFYLADKEPHPTGGTHGAPGRVDDAPAFTDEDERLIGVLAAHAAIAIENARLAEQNRELSIIEERNRIARELHDALTQTLFSLTLTVDAAASLVPTDPARALEGLARAQELVRDAFGEIRGVIAELRPPALGEDGLVVTVGKHLDLVARTHGLTATLDASGDRATDPVLDRELYRIVQEALTNVVRHASASSVEVRIVLGSDRVVLIVRDDGVGFDPTARAVRGRRLGLTSMRERAEGLGGTFVVDSGPGRGARVTVEFPVG